MQPVKRSLNVHLGELREPWDDYCANRNKKPATALRELVVAELAQNIEKPKALALSQVSGEADTRPKVRKDVRFTQSEYEQIEAACELEDVSFQRWLINLVRANLTSEPQFNMKETQVLWESCYQLRAIGRNINQIAKQLNEGKSRELGERKLDYLVELINSHTELVNNMVAANVNRWVVK